MNMTDIDIIRRFVRLCDDGWQQGWHERNGGNLSYRMSAADVSECRPYFNDLPGGWTPLGVSVPNLAGEHFIVTGTGKYFRNMALAPQDNCCVAELDAAGERYRIVWGLARGGGPTSEFPTHLMNHAVRKEVTNGACRVIYHAHTPAVIAMTFIMPLTARDFTRALWQSMTECPVVFPGGVGVVEWMVPGGAEIAVATSKLMREYDSAIWAHHGTFVSGVDFDAAFGLMHTIEKAADICTRVLATGQSVRQTIPDAGLRAIAKDFGLTLREEFLED